MQKKSFRETGRTMIEMLGVIGILGMMSVGGAVGVSRVIDFRRGWQLQTQVPQLVRDIKALYSWQSDYTQMDMRTICKNVKVDGAGCTNLAFKSSWGGQIIVTRGGDNLYGFDIEYSDVPQVILNQVEDMAFSQLSKHIDNDNKTLVFSTYKEGDYWCGDTVCIGSAVCDEEELKCICENGEDPNRGCEAEFGSCPVGTSTSGNGGYTGGSNLEGNRCYCQNADTKWNGSTCVDQDGTCSSFADCNRGEYCQFSPTPCDDDIVDTLTSGVCEALNGTDGTEFNEGFLWVEGGSYDWWTAQDICLANGMRMVSPSDLGCQYSQCVSDVMRSIMYEFNTFPFSFWTADLENEGNPNSCNAWSVSGGGPFSASLLTIEAYSRSSDTNVVLCTGNSTQGN